MQKLFCLRKTFLNGKLINKWNPGGVNTRKIKLTSSYNIQVKHAYCMYISQVKNNNDILQIVYACWYWTHQCLSERQQMYVWQNHTFRTNTSKHDHVFFFFNQHTKIQNSFWPWVKIRTSMANLKISVYVASAALAVSLKIGDEERKRALFPHKFVCFNPILTAKHSLHLLHEGLLHRLLFFPSVVKTSLLPPRCQRWAI